MVKKVESLRSVFRNLQEISTGGKKQNWPSMPMMKVIVHVRIALGFYKFNQTRYV
jgi:hypothetical protein